MRNKVNLRNVWFDRNSNRKINSKEKNVMCKQENYIILMYKQG